MSHDQCELSKLEELGVLGKLYELVELVELYIIHPIQCKYALDELSEFVKSNKLGKLDDLLYWKKWMN